MTSRSLWVAGPLTAAGIVAAVYATHGATQAMLNVENVVIFGAALVGSLLAAFAFGRGDYLRLAWGLMGACYALLLTDTLLFGASSSALPHALSETEAKVSTALTIAANLATVVALLRVARAWKVAGLDFQVSRLKFWGSIAAVVTIAVAILGKELLAGLQELAQGDSSGGVHVASSIGDIAATAVLVPLLLTALSLRGGSLVWPWALLTTSTVLWLLLDMLSLADGQSFVLPLEEALRVSACFFQLTAGLAQRQSLKG